MDPKIESELRDNFYYNPETGFIHHSKQKRRIKEDSIAGSAGERGYVILSHKNKSYSAHRLAWFLYHNEWPNFIDHINGMTGDNRICNLRNVSPRENSQNARKHRLGIKLPGVETCTGYKACITIDGKKKFLGIYSTAEEAHKVYKQFIKDNNL